MPKGLGEKRGARGGDHTREKLVDATGDRGRVRRVRRAEQGAERLVLGCDIFKQSDRKSRLPLAPMSSHVERAECDLQTGRSCQPKLRGAVASTLE
eukprot:2514199-Pleurochrysis_carterae.AAC.1